MRVGASSASWIAMCCASAAFAMGFLMLATPIPREIAIGLTAVFFLLALISAYGAYRAHYHPEHANVTLEAPPPHNLLCVDLQVRTIYLLHGNMVVSRSVEGETDDGHKALIAVYSNSPSPDRPVGIVRGVRASVAPVSSSMKIYGGLWLDESSDAVTFNPGSAVRELLLLYTDDDGSVWAVEDRREVDGRVLTPRHVCIFDAPHMMGGLQVTVELSANGQVINRARFFVELHPLSADLAGQEQIGCPANEQQIAAIQNSLGDASKMHVMIAARNDRKLLPP